MEIYNKIDLFMSQFEPIPLWFTISISLVSLCIGLFISYKTKEVKENKRE